MSSFKLNLSSCFQDDEELLEPQEINGVKIIKDGGLRYTDFGNAAGGNFAGIYRYFIVDNNGNNDIVSMNIFALGKCVNDPVFGNRKGQSSIVVAIDSKDKSHMSLMLSIDRHVDVCREIYKVYHDGSITVGKKGRLKNSEVINYIRNNDPELYDSHNRIFLGEVDNSKEIRINAHKTKNLVVNLIKYALLRDEIRKDAKKLKRCK